MSAKLDIPDTIAGAIRLPEYRIKAELLNRLAITLYVQGLLSFGKAWELAGVGKYEFGVLLGERGVERHYTAAEIDRRFGRASPLFLSVWVPISSSIHSGNAESML